MMTESPCCLGHTDLDRMDSGVMDGVVLLAMFVDAAREGPRATHVKEVRG